jgi:ABC-type sugar transport system permease subunit
MKDILITAAFVGLIVAVVNMVFHKYRVSQNWDYRRHPKLPEYCELCVAFWMCVAQVFWLRFVNVHELSVVHCFLSALCATPIALLFSRNENV